MGWAEYIAALVAFLLSHTVPLRPEVRTGLTAVLGGRGFTVAYSALSLGILGWLIAAAGRAPFIPLWYWEPWHNHAVLAVMLVVCLILALSLGRPNPFSFGGANNHLFDPSHPGIVALTRHPLLDALALWSGAHLVPNGDLAHVILFGAFAVFAILGRRIIDRRKRRQMGGRWDDLRRALAQREREGPGAALRLSPVRILAGLLAYAALILAHPFLFGVSPLP